MATRKRRRGSLSLRSLLLLMLIALAYFVFDGLYESPGAGKGKDQASRAPLQKDPVQIQKRVALDAPSKDELDATSARFERLVSERSFADARELAVGMSASPHVAERELARGFRGRLQAVGEEVVRSCSTAIDSKDMEEAEARLRELERGFPELAQSYLAGLGTSGKETASLNVATLVSDLLRAKLPLAIDKVTTLQEIRSGQLILRIKGEKGGVRHRRMSMTQQDPLVWRKLLIRVAGGIDAANPAISALGSLYEAERRPLAAALLRSGLEKVQAALRDCVPRAGGKPR